MPELVLKVLDSMGAIAPPDWDALTDHHPLLSHAFLHTLHDSGCASAQTGWRPQFLTWWQTGPTETLVAALPLYRKTHSYGEYVFDWAWAQAYERAGGRYFPKLTSAIPFTPCPGPRLLAREGIAREALMQQAIEWFAQAGVSSWHVLLCNEDEARAWQRCGLTLRRSLQFHWQNELPAGSGFDAWLALLRNDKRKKIKQERRYVAEAGITFKTTLAPSDSEWQHFYACYERTYREHRSTPYLTLGCFQALGTAMPEQWLMVTGYCAGRPICAALNAIGFSTLYGRYWGALEHHASLHFEACYYQAIAWCLEHGIERFEGGAQGAHKLARGFLPTPTYSVHGFADPRLGDAVANFLKREGMQVAQGIDELADHSPFRDPDGTPL